MTLMEERNFVTKLNRWHDNDEHAKIIDAIEKIPLAERNFEITGLYARAMINGTERYQEALEQLMLFEEHGREDGVWNFRVGCCLYYLKRKPEAAVYFQSAIDHGDEWEETKEMLQRSLNNDPWDYLFDYIDQYSELADKYPNDEVTKYLNDAQLTLLAYNYLYGQVTNGGFIQLIQNGYGGFVFDSPFLEIINKWGAEKIAEIVEKAQVVYEKHKDELEKKTTLKDFSKLYKKITDFEPLEDQFYAIMDSETEIIKHYVENHTEEFTVI